MKITVHDLDESQPGWTTCQACHHWWRAHGEDGDEPCVHCGCPQLVAVLKQPA